MTLKTLACEILTLSTVRPYGLWRALWHFLAPLSRQVKRLKFSGWPSGLLSSRLLTSLNQYVAGSTAACFIVR